MDVPTRQSYLMAFFPIFADLPPTPPTPHMVATRVADAPKLDGKLDDPVWASAPASSAFTQKFPNEGEAPTDKTTMRIVYDDEAIYVAFECEQTHASIVDRLTRRGRLVESDWVSVAFGTRGDGKTAYEFTVNAAGVLVDTLRFNRTAVGTDHRTGRRRDLVRVLGRQHPARRRARRS